jgi:hypothetical protein
MWFPPAPAATNRLPFQAMARPVPVIWGDATPVQLMPLEEYAIVLVPDPTATHKLPFQAMPYPALEKVVAPRPVQLIPSGDVAIVLVP